MNLDKSQNLTTESQPCPSGVSTGQTPLHKLITGRRDVEVSPALSRSRPRPPGSVKLTSIAASPAHRSKPHRRAPTVHLPWRRPIVLRIILSDCGLHCLPEFGVSTPVVHPVRTRAVMRRRRHHSVTRPVRACTDRPTGPMAGAARRRRTRVPPGRRSPPSRAAIRRLRVQLSF